MNLLGGLKERLIGRVHHRGPDEGEIKSHVLGTYPPAPATAESIESFREPDLGEPAVPPGAAGAGLPEWGAPEAGPPPAMGPALARGPAMEELPRGRGERGEREESGDREFRRATEGKGLYEIFDRLAIIETQLATVRAQSETINERLKTIELFLRTRLGSTNRYGEY